MMTNAHVSALDDVPESLIDKLRAVDRVVLVASNPDVSRRHVRRAGITPRSLVLSFNKCGLLYRLPWNTSHVFVHRFGIRKQRFFGYPQRWKVALFKRLARESETFLLGGEAPATTAENVHWIPMRGDLALLDGYPFDELPERGGASTGFYMIALLIEIRTALDLDFDIVLVGFSDGGGGKQWYGHAWAFEREAVARHGLRVIEARAGEP
ncbi:hypothetical protein [Salinicola rhizosphaerae]|nr:hypothetical protein [Salinicola rhizosphaerae]